MVRKAKTARILALILTVVLLMSTVSVAGAASSVEEAKASLATVDITQVYNRKEVDKGVHNYSTDGDEVDITYSATLKMTEEMATYLQVRQTQLMKAEFVVHVNMDMNLLEFNTNADTVKVTFSSTFLKPQDSRNYSYKLTGYDAATSVYTYEITADRAWAEKQKSFDIPAELIVYYDGSVAYGYDDAKVRFADKPLMYAGFTVADWMHEVKATIANMRVKDSVAPTVTENSATWKTVVANGTVEGVFTYISGPADTIGVLATYESLGYTTTLAFGNDQDITEWTSNEVSVLLKRDSGYTPTPVIPAVPDSPYLNLDDHFAYIIGYPEDYITGEPTDDMTRWPVKPEGTITRAEVATIFFRMLTDETRNQYWSKTNPYTDVDAGDWYNNAISTLTKLEVINGYPDGSFQPNGNITRAEFATMAVRFFIITEEYTWNEDAFSDIAGHWANEYINLAYLLDIVNGYPDGTYRPGNAITRAEAMTIVNNTLRRTPCKEGLLPTDVMIMWPDNMNASVWYYEEVQEATNSHAYTYFDNGDENWTAELPVRDWAAFERAWSDANSAANPGEVVDGH